MTAIWLAQGARNQHAPARGVLQATLALRLAEYQWFLTLFSVRDMRRAISAQRVPSCATSGPSAASSAAVQGP